MVLEPFPQWILNMTLFDIIKKHFTFSISVLQNLGQRSIAQYLIITHFGFINFQEKFWPVRSLALY